MIDFKKYIASKLLGQKLHFNCDCLIGIDVVGTVVDYEIYRDEIIFLIDVDGKIIKIGENHPHMRVASM